MTRFFNITHKLFSGLDLLFPPNCAGCKNPGHRWCPDCEENTPKITENICLHCGLPHTNSGQCMSCRNNPPSYTAARAWGFHTGPLRKAVHQLKYQRDIALGEKLAEYLEKLLSNQNWKIDLILPIPLAKRRMKKRGYNQAVLLAYPLAHYLDLEYSSKALIRNRETRTQIGLNRYERRENVKNAFAPNSNMVKEKNILLVDDVITTGATLDSASKSLLAAGANSVYAATLARAASLFQK
ncbi:MAG: ComF family protein [Chloroflexi bacterium]|nr:ComF family protein [Chloroflexota bacterium]